MTQSNGKQTNGRKNATGFSRNKRTPGANRKKLHRLGEIRRREAVSRRAVARRMGVTVAVVERQERETADIPLSALQKWQEALGVPLTELLVEEGTDLSAPVMQRAQMVRLMRTALTILQRTRSGPVKRLAQTLVNQLLEIMPELREVTPWQSVGQRRTTEEYGRAALRSFPENVFRID